MVMVLVSGFSVGLLMWRLTVDAVIFNSLVFANNIDERQRGRLLTIVLAMVLLFLLLWIAAVLFSKSRDRVPSATVDLHLYIGIGAIAGLLPVLSIPAIEQYHTVFTFCVLVSVLAALLAVSRGFQRGWVYLLRSGRQRSTYHYLIASGMFICYAFFFIAYSIAKHRSFHTYAFDLGWQNQVFYTLLRTGNPIVTGFLDIRHLSNHFQPMYFLLSPIYAIAQRPETLLVMQAVFIASAVFPLYFLCLHKTRSTWLATAFSAAFLLYPALQGANSYDFHGVTLIVPCLGWILYFMTLRKWRWYWVFFTLALLVREDTAITLFGVGLFLLFCTKDRKTGVVSLFVCIFYFLVTMRIMSAMGGFANLENYWPLVLPESQDFAGVVKTILTNPFYVFQHVALDPGKIIYLVHLLLPLCFLPLFAGKRLVLILPGITVLLFSGMKVHHSIGFQYSSHIVMPMCFLAVCGLERLRKKLRVINPEQVAMLVITAALLMNFEFGIFFSKRFQGFSKAPERYRSAYDLIELIPAGASVTADARLYPHLSGRHTIHLIDRMRGSNDYVAVNLRNSEPALDPYEEIYSRHASSAAFNRSVVKELLMSNEYGVRMFNDGFILLEKGGDTALNVETREAISAMDFQAKPKMTEYYRDPALEVLPPRLSESDRFQAFLERYRSGIVIIAGRGDAYSRLSYMAKKHLMYRNSAVHLLSETDSFVAVLKRDELVYENRSGEPLRVESGTVPELDELLATKHISIYSNGNPNNPRVSIAVDGVEMAEGGLGMNVVALNLAGNLVVSDSFNTGDRTDE